MRAITLTIVLIATIFAGVPTSYGQSSSSDGERIRRLREEIQTREKVEPPPDLIELNRSKLIERRAELRTLLKTEIIRLQRHQTDLGSFISAEEAQRINDLLQGYSTEIDRLGLAMQRDLSAEASTGTRANSVPAIDSRTDPAAMTGDGPDSKLAPSLKSVETNGNGAALSAAANTNTSPAVTVGTNASTIAPVSPALTANLEDQKETLDCDDVLQLIKPSSELDKITCGLIREVKDRANNRIQVSGSTDQFDLIKILIAKKSTPTYLVEASEIRLDKQLGASAANGVSPSLVTRGGVPAILGFAVENGGLAESTNNSAITFRGNPVGLFNALKNRGFVPSVKQDENDPILRFLKKTSFAFTFNTDRGRDPGVFTGSSQQLAAVSARVELINKRIPTLYIRDWEDFLATKAQNLSNVINESQFIDTTTQRWIDPAMQSWFEQTQANLAAATDPEVSGVLQAALDKLPVKDLRPETLLLLDGIEKALGLYMSGRDSVLEKINSGTVLTFEYLNKREVNEPDTSNFTFIAEKGTSGGKLNFTLNGSLTMFNNLDSLRNFVAANPTLPKPRRLRDFQFAGQMDIPLGNVREFGQWVLFASGRYERLLENATTDLGLILPNTAGDIAQLQLGLKIPVAKSGFKIPVSITFANRTELIKERTVKGNFGFSLDLDTLFSKFKPF